MKINQSQKNIPDGWKQVALGDLFDFKNGLNSEKENFGHGIRFINIMEILKHDFLIAEDIPGRINVDQKRGKENLVEYGDVLFNRTSETPEEVGMTSVYLDTEPVVFGGFVIRAKPKSKELNDLFKKYCFSSEMFRKEVIKQGQGVVRGNIGQSNLRVIPFLLPPTNEQIKIASILETWNQVIEKVSKKIEIKKEIKKGLMDSLLSGTRRLKGFNDEWKKIKIEDLIIKKEKTNRQSGHSLDFGKYPFFNNSSKSFNQYANEFDFDGEMIIANTGGVAYFDYYFGKFAAMSDCFVFETNQNCKFLFYVLKKLENIINHKGFTGSGIKHLDKKFFYKLKVALPSVKEQVAISEILTTADKEIIDLERRLTILKEQKRYLLNNLITGTIRTPETLSANK